MKGCDQYLGLKRANMAALVGTVDVSPGPAKEAEPQMQRNWAVRPNPALDNRASNTGLRNKIAFCLQIACLAFLVALGPGPKPRRGRRGLSPQMRQESLQEQTLEITIVGNPTISDGPILGLSGPFFILYGT